METPSLQATFLQLLYKEKHNAGHILEFIHNVVASGNVTLLYELALTLESHISDEAIDPSRGRCRAII
jgi:hypothetical protein